jgi:uncharacterized membrane protein
MSDIPPPPPPPPPSGDAGFSSSPGGSVDIGKALGYAWKKFSANPINWILLALIPVLANLFGYALSFLLRSDSLVGQFFVSFISLIFFVVSLIVQYGLVRAALLTTEGREVSPGDAWKDTSTLGTYIGAVIIQGLLIMVGFIFCCIGAPIVAFFTVFTPFFAVEGGRGAWGSVTASFNFVKEHIGKLILFIIVMMVIWLIGGALCTVGLLVAMPIVLIASAFVYKEMTGQPVAP